MTFPIGAGLVLLAAASLHGSTLAQAPSTTDGSTADLSCRVVASTPLPGSVLFEVEVRNASARTAEPVVFAVRIGKPPTEHRLERCPMPYVGRNGRGIAARSLQRYQLQIATAEDPKTLAVEVIAAVFRDAPPAAESPVQIGALRQGHVTIETRRVAATYVAIQNRSDQPVDAILLGTFAQPDGGKALVTVRLAAREVRELDVAVRPTQLAWKDAPGSEGVRLTRIEVVDWTAFDPQATADASLAGALLRAYERWHCWREPWPSGEGTFRAVYSRSTHQDGAPVTISGRFMLKDVAPPLLFVDERMDLEPRQALERAIDAAFADLRRSPRAQFEQQNRLSVQDRDRYLVQGPGWSGQFGKLVEVRDDRILGVAETESPATIWQRWLLQDLGQDYLVVGRDTTQLALGRTPMEIERRTYAPSGRWIVPVTYRRETSYRGFREAIALEIACGPLQQRGESIPPVGGPGAAALQQAWENGYRYPAGPVPLRAKFEVTTPGTDDLWHGQRRVKGKLEIAAFRGFSMDGQGLSPRTFVIDGKNQDQLTQDQLGAAVFDRLLLWALRDFAGRQPFADAVRGATVLQDPERPGVFTLGNCALVEIEVHNGLVARLRWSSGQERTIGWQKLGTVMVPTRISTGDEVLTASWKKLDRDWIVPVELELLRVFGRDWGPESLRLTDVSVK